MPHAFRLPPSRVPVLAIAAHVPLARDRLHEPTASYLSDTAGLGLAILATIASFVVWQTNLLRLPGIPVGLIVLAFAQIGVHLVFFLHLGSSPDSTNNILALAFGVLIVFLCLDHRQSQQQHGVDVRAMSGGKPS
jgi:heme/copper-type cytochrome/quinol oxidase subunit 4